MKSMNCVLILLIFIAPCMSFAQESKDDCEDKVVREFMAASKIEADKLRARLIEEAQNEFSKDDLDEGAMKIAMKLVSNYVIIEGCKREDLVKIFGNSVLYDFKDGVIAIALQRSKKMARKIIKHSVDSGGLPFKMGPQWFLVVKLSKDKNLLDRNRDVSIEYVSLEYLRYGRFIKASSDRTK